VGDFGRLRFEARLACNLGLVHRQSDRLSAAIGNGLFLKRSGGEIEALAWIIAIDRFDPLDPAAFLRLAGDPMAAAYIRSKPRARMASRSSSLACGGSSWRPSAPRASCASVG
jgi:hypothetical protein